MINHCLYLPIYTCVYTNHPSCTVSPNTPGVFVPLQNHHVDKSGVGRNEGGMFRVEYRGLSFVHTGLLVERG